MDTMIELLEKEIVDLNNAYNTLLKQDKKYPELKEIKTQLRKAQADLDALTEK